MFGFQFGKTAVDVQLVVDSLDLLAEGVELHLDGGDFTSIASNLTSIIFSMASKRAEMVRSSGARKS